MIAGLMKLGVACGLLEARGLHVDYLKHANFCWDKLS